MEPEPIAALTGRCGGSLLAGSVRGTGVSWIADRCPEGWRGWVVHTTDDRAGRPTWSNTQLLAEVVPNGSVRRLRIEVVRSRSGGEGVCEILELDEETPAITPSRLCLRHPCRPLQRVRLACPALKRCELSLYQSQRGPLRVIARSLFCQSGRRNSLIVAPRDCGPAW